MELAGAAPFYPCGLEYDMVLQRMRDTECTAHGVLQKMQKALGRSLDSPRKKTSKSRSKSRKYRHEDQQMEKTDGNLAMFPGRVPWVQSTPSRSTAYRTDTPAAREVELSLPPQPVLPPPPPILKEEGDEPLSSEEMKLLEHLRGLQEMKIALPEEMSVKMQSLVQREQRQASAKALSHGHLNRLNKLRAQATNAGKKVRDLDAEWDSFVAKTNEKVRQHAMLFQECRANLLEIYNQKLKELQQAKEEVSIASQSLLEQQQAELPTMFEQPDVQQQLQDLQMNFAEGGRIGEAIDLTDAAMEDEVELLADGSDGMASKASPKAMRPFRSAASPSGVAKTHLKPKESKEIKDKHKEKEQKDDK